jgi:shikimate dehydrogenase
LLFPEDGRVIADNTDGEGLLGAFALQAPEFDPKGGPIVILGAGGAARGAAAAFLLAGAPKIRIVNRTRARAEVIAATLGDRVGAFGWADLPDVLDDATALVNATSLGLEGHDPLEANIAGLPTAAPVMDMVYRPLHTPLLEDAARAGHPTVDGLAMLVLQAVPSFEAFFGQAPPRDVDVRALALAALETGS